ncbi:MAG: hypothetical protein ACTH63_23835, partial [Pseudomonas helleri]
AAPYRKGQVLHSVFAAAPLQAFFYLDSSGKAGAQYDQQDFLKETGILVPIILITLPATEADQATFQFIPEDQAPSLHTQR